MTHKLFSISIFIAVFLILSGCASDSQKETRSAERQITIGDVETIDSTLHKMMLGVISGPEPTAKGTGPTLTKEYQDIGIVSIRNNDYYDDRLDMEGIFNCGGNTYPSWEGCDATDDANYDWAKSDAEYQAYIDGGFVPFLRIGGEWANLNPEHDFKGPQNAAQEENWIIAANKMVDRYQNWPQKPDAFTYLNIWTEFPGQQFWDRPNPAFIQFWIKAYKSVKSAHPELKVGGPGFGAGVSIKVSQGDGGTAEGLLQELYKQNIKLDWFGWHTFGSDPTVYGKVARAYQDLLDGTGAFEDVPWADTNFFAETEVFTDAYGNGGGDVGRGVELVPVSTAKGAAILTAGWISLQFADIQGAFYYRGNDQGSPTTTPDKSKFGKDNSLIPGLFTSAGDYKPGANAFRLWSQLTNNYDTLLTTDGTNNDVWALAAKNSTGGIAVLVANTSDQDTTISIDNYSDGTVYLLDDSHDGRTGIAITSSTISLPSGAVELIELKNIPGKT